MEGERRIVKHGVYRKIDGRYRDAREIKAMANALLEKFPSSPPAMAQLLAKRCAYKLIRAASYEAFVMTGKKAPALKADRDYLNMTAQIRSDLQALNQLRKDGGPA